MSDSIETVDQLQLGVLPHRRDPSGYHFLGTMKTMLGGQIRTYKQLFVRRFDSSQYRFFAESIQKLIYSWNKCLYLDDMLTNETLMLDI